MALRTIRWRNPSRRRDLLMHPSAPGPARRSALMLLLVVGGCAGVPQEGSSGTHWSDARELRSAAVAAAKNPRTWGPLAAAALVSAVGVDDDLSDWIADEQPLFGSDAADTSDTLRDVALASYLVSALAVPSDTATNKLSDLGVGIATLYAQGALVSGLKEVTRRRRPNYSNRLSLPSGHTATASAASTLAMHNLARIDMPSSMRTTAAVGLEAVVIGTGWARVEARKHFAADVLAGYAVGHFMAAFAQAAFIDRRLPGAQVAFYPVEGGGAIRLTVPIARSP